MKFHMPTLGAAIVILLIIVAAYHFGIVKKG